MLYNDVLTVLLWLLSLIVNNFRITYAVVDSVQVQIYGTVQAIINQQLNNVFNPINNLKFIYYYTYYVHYINKFSNCCFRY